jgi:hypothetical protein
MARICTLAVFVCALVFTLGVTAFRALAAEPIPAPARAPAPRLPNSIVSLNSADV